VSSFSNMNTSEHGAHVEELYLKENLLEELPRDLHKSLPILSNMYLHKNNILRLPEDMGYMQNLTVLDLSKNHLKNIPKSMKNLVSLKTLDLSHNHLKELDDNIFKISTLEYLVAVGNMITSLPATVSKLSHLSGLYLSRNMIVSVPDSLADCMNIHELYLDHNLLTSIPSMLTMLPSISILSLASNKLITLPALPFISCPRLILEDNPHLHHIPYMTGCQQTIMTYSSQATWAAMAGPVVQNTLQGIWNMRLQGCSQSGVTILDPEYLNIEVVGGKYLALPPPLVSVTTPTDGSIPSLTELCLKRTYNLMSRSVNLSVNISQDIHLHIQSLSVRSEGMHLPSCYLPANLSTTLARGPTAFCSYPACNQPIFQESCVEVLQKEVQRSFLGTGEVEMMNILATRLYCSSACYTNYSLGDIFPWERQLLKKGLEWIHKKY